MPDDLDVEGMGPQELVQYIRPDAEIAESPGDEAARAHLSTGEVMRYEPMNALEITFAIQEIQAALDRYATVYPLLVSERYATERAWIKKEAEMRLAAPGGGYDQDRRAYAKLNSMEELEAFQLAKEKQYSADALEKALRAKLFGYLNMNKVQATLYNSAQYGHGA